MYALDCPSCFGLLDPAGELIKYMQVELMKWGYPDTGSPGVWSKKLGAALRKFQEAQKVGVLTGTPEYWTVHMLIEREVGFVPFSDWAPLYLKATGKAPDESTWRIQYSLRQLNFNPGPVDGRMGKKTRAAVRLWQKMAGLAQTGVLDPVQLARLVSEALGGATTLGTELVVGRVPEPLEEPAEVEEVVAEAEAAGVLVRIQREPAVSEPKIVVEREPRTGAMLSITKLIPAKPGPSPWLWVGLSAGAVVLVGGVILYLRRRKQASVSGLGMSRKKSGDITKRPAWPQMKNEKVEATIKSKRGGIVVDVISFTNQYGQTAYMCRVVKDYRRSKKVGREYTPGPGADFAYAVEVANKIIKGTW